MARPSQDIDQALLRSGRALFAQCGCAGLSLRALADHAGVNVGMFHYHFKTKDNFLRMLLQQMYEEMFASLAREAMHAGTAIDRLRATLVALARFARVNRRLIARVWMDAIAGESVAQEFFRRNAPRHLGLLLTLMTEAQKEGALRSIPPVQRFVTVMGAIALPMIFIAGLVEARVVPDAMHAAFDAEVMSDAAIERRVALVLATLGGGATARQRAPAARARRGARR